MHRLITKRLIAKFLLLVALVGNLAPLALAATAAPLHACCLRKTVHHCHDSAAAIQVSEAAQLLVHDASPCNHDCCRAVTTSQWAHAQPPVAIRVAHEVEAYLGQSSPVTTNAEFSSSQSTRAPPSC
jgi:hypothetical protein